MLTDVDVKIRQNGKASNLPRLIFVVDDGTPEVQSQSEPPESDSSQSEASSPPTDPLGQVGTALGNIGNEVAKGVGKIGDGAASILKGLGGEGVDARAVSRSDALLLDFPPGHPQGRVLYVRHPVKFKSYLPAAYFHRRVFEHKFWEAVRVLMWLGAKELEVKHVSGWGKEFSAEIRAPVGLRPHVEGKSERDTRLLFTGELEGVETPSVPPDVVWFGSEPGWQTIAEGRVRCRLKHFTMEVSYEDDFGVNASLEAAAGKVGLRLGGKFQSHQATIWWIDATF